MTNSKTTHNQGQMILASNPWKTPLKDVMELIMSRLNSTDYIRTSAVCSSWRSLLLRSDIIRPRNPWLLIDHYSQRHIVKFFNLSDDDFHTFDLSAIGRQIVGSSRGWLIIMTMYYHHTEIKFSLFNPIFGTEFQLPPLPVSLCDLHRVELSSTEISNCTVAAILDNYKKLAIYKLGDEKWEILEQQSKETEEEFTFIDIIFCHQKLHVLISTKSGNNGKIEDLIIKSPETGETLSITLIHDLIDIRTDYIEVEDSESYLGYKVYERRGHNSYLVESIKGRVLLIHKRYKSFFVTKDVAVNMFDENSDDYDDGDMVYESTHVVDFKVNEVEEYDLNGKARVLRSKRLGDEQTVFLSNYSRVCLPLVNNNNFKGNCIYFVMDFVNPAIAADFDYFPGLIDINGVFHLDERRLEDLQLPRLKLPWSEKFTWFAPNLAEKLFNEVAAHKPLDL